VTFKNAEDLTNKIDDIYARLDEDESGGLAFREFKEGVKQFSRHKLQITNRKSPL